MKKTFICAAHTGGQGKTTVSQAIHRAIRQRGGFYKLVSADYCDDQGRSKLGKFHPGKVTELGMGALLESAKLENDENSALKYWDRFGQILIEGGAVVDVGANVIGLLMQWAQHRNVHKILTGKNASPIEILLICKAEKHALQDICELVKLIGGGKFVPFSGITVVQNEVGGNFHKMDVRRAISEAAPKIHVRYITIPRCTSELWGRLEQTYTPVEKILAMREEEVAEELDVDVWSASAGLSDLKSWVSVVDNELKRHFDLDRSRAAVSAPAELEAV